MTNGCEHLLLFGFIFSNWNQKCYQNAPNLYQNEAKMVPKTDKMVPRSFQKPIRVPRSSFDGQKAPQIDQNLSRWCQNGSKMLPKWNPKASKIHPKIDAKIDTEKISKNMEKYTKHDAKIIKKTIPKSNFSSNLDFVKNLVFPLGKTIILRFQRAPKLMKIHSENDTKTSFEKMMQKLQKIIKN